MVSDRSVTAPESDKSDKKTPKKRWRRSSQRLERRRRWNRRNQDGDIDVNVDRFDDDSIKLTDENDDERNDDDVTRFTKTIKVDEDDGRRR